MSVALSFFRVLAAATSMLMILSPVPTMYRIARAKVVGHHSIVPLVSMLANSHMNLLYGYLVHNIFPIFVTFVVGDILSIIYIAIFYRYTDDRATANKAIVCFVVPLTLVTLYAALGPVFFGQTKQQVGETVGYLSIVSTLVMYSAPFEKIGLVLQHRSAVFLNIHMVVTGTFTNSVWVTYTALAKEWIIFAPNVFTVLAGVIQIALYIMYNPRTHPLTDLDLPSKCDDTMPVAVVVSPSAACSSTDFVTAPTPRPLAPLHLD